MTQSDKEKAISALKKGINEVVPLSWQDFFHEQLKVLEGVNTKPLHPDLQIVVDKLEKLIADIRENPQVIADATFNQHHEPMGVKETITINTWKLPTR